MFLLIMSRGLNPQLSLLNFFLKNNTIILPETNIAMEHPPFWWYLPGNLGIFYGYVSLTEGMGNPHIFLNPNSCDVIFSPVFWFFFVDNGPENGDPSPGVPKKSRES